MKKDNLILGITLGFIMPFFGLLIYYFLGFYRYNVSMGEYLGLFKQRQFLTAVSSLALLANVVLFTIYINSRFDKTARGIFAATMVYAIIVLLIKIVG